MRPLEGLTVLDLTRLLPGPYCSWILRSWGARVIKVEDPRSGDYLRKTQPVWFDHLNAGAESISLDLKLPGEREVFLKLASRVDAVLEGFRPGVMKRLGLGWHTLADRNPRLVLVSLSGYNSRSDLAGRAGHDINYLARTGLLSLMSEMPPVQLADLTGGLFAAAAAMAALVRASRTGEGCHTEVALFDAVAALGALQAAEALAGQPPVREQMPLAGGLGVYNVYETADGGRVSLGALEPKFWTRFCHLVGRPDLVDRYGDPDLKEELRTLFQSHPLAHWTALARGNDICLEPVLSLGEAAGAGSVSQPAWFGDERPGVRGRGPRLGEHTGLFLREHGLSEQEISNLSANKK